MSVVLVSGVLAWSWLKQWYVSELICINEWVDFWARMYGWLMMSVCWTHPTHVCVGVIPTYHAGDRCVLLSPKHWGCSRRWSRGCIPSGSTPARAYQRHWLEESTDTWGEENKCSAKYVCKVKRSWFILKWIQITWCSESASITCF